MLIKPMAHANMYEKKPQLMLQYVAVCCSVFQYVAVCCSVLQYIAVCCSMLQYVAVCCSVLQCVAVYPSVATTHADLLLDQHVLQCSIVWCSVCCSVL